MATAPQHTPTIPEEDRLRADFYNFLGLVLAGPPDQLLLDQIAGLSGDGSDLGQAIATMARVAKVTKPAAATREFNALFVGLGRGELLPYASYYLTGFLNEKPLAQLRQDMAAQGWSARVLELDVSDVAATRKAVVQSGPFDILLNSAGLARHSKAVDTQPDDFDAVMGVNVKGAYFLTRPSQRA